MNPDITSPFVAQRTGKVPGIEECYSLWNNYDMLANIRLHSQMVAEVATEMALMAQKQNMEVDLNLVVAAALLHDLGKTYTVRYGGNHSQIGASWTMQETGNPAIAQCVMHHVFWPGEIDLKKYFLPLLIIYADKRVKHDSLVSLDERYADILTRYGSSAFRKERIQRSYKQNKCIEQGFNQLLKVDWESYSFELHCLF